MVQEICMVLNSGMDGKKKVEPRNIITPTTKGVG